MAVKPSRTYSRSRVQCRPSRIFVSTESKLRREPFWRFLTTQYRGPRTGQPLSDRSADSYCAYALRAGSALMANLDTLDLTERGEVAVVGELRASQRQAGLPDATLNNCISSLRAYGQFIQLEIRSPLVDIPRHRADRRAMNRRLWFAVRRFGARWLRPGGNGSWTSAGRSEFTGG
jgi:hypothetical protein